MRTWSITLLVALAAACSDGTLDAWTATNGGASSGGAGGGGTSNGGEGGRTAAAGRVGGDSGSAGLGGAAGDATGEAAGSGGYAGAGPQPPIIDDFEDGDTQALAPEGWWYLVNDGTGSQRFGIEPVTRADSTYAIRTQGEGFSDWGAKLGVDLEPDDVPFDASSYGSLRFYARAETDTLTSIRVSLLDATDYFGSNLEIETTWQEYVVPFAELRRPDGTGSIDPATLMSLEFFASPSEPFDFWVDDLAFGE